MHALTRTFQGTTNHTYPFDTSEEGLVHGYSTPRTHQQTEEFAAVADKSGKAYMGVKGYSVLQGAPTFDIIRGVTIDYMHAVLIGVMKKLLELWTSKEMRTMDWYIGTQVEELDRRLRALSPPHRIHRFPRPIKDLAQWKASELKNFLLFYSLPVLDGILPLQYYDHFALLIKGIFLLLQTCISRCDISAAGSALVQFCLMFDGMYDPCLESIGLHGLLHMCRKVEDLGPLWAHSCFFYEDLNGDIRSMFHGTQNVPSQVLNAVHIQQKLPNLITALLPGTPAELLYAKLTSHHKVHSVVEPVGDGVFAVGCMKLYSLPETVHNLLQQTEGKIVHCEKFDRILLRGSIIQSIAYKMAKKTRRNTSAVKFTDRNGDTKFVMVQFYTKNHTNTGITYTAIGHELQRTDKPVDVPHIVQVIERKDNIHVIPILAIQAVCFYMKVEAKSCYIACFPNVVDRD